MPPCHPFHCYGRLCYVYCNEHYDHAEGIPLMTVLHHLSNYVDNGLPHAGESFCQSQVCTYLLHKNPKKPVHFLFASVILYPMLHLIFEAGFGFDKSVCAYACVAYLLQHSMARHSMAQHGTAQHGFVQVLFMSDQQLSDMHHKAAVDPAPPGEWGSFSSPAHTVVLRNHMGAPCNCAMASPDGNWIAVVGDTPSLLLLHISEAYDHSKLPPGVTRKPGASKGSVLKFGAKQPRRTSRSNPRNTGSSAGESLLVWSHESKGFLAAAVMHLCSVWCWCCVAALLFCRTLPSGLPPFNRCLHEFLAPACLCSFCLVFCLLSPFLTSPSPP